MRRTLLTAGVFALLAMIYVPAPSQKHPFSSAHYRFIFSQHETGIAFFQLLVNVAFAALLGAILATVVPKIATGVRRLPKRVWLGLGGLVLIALLIAAGVAWSNLTEAAQRDERYADELLRARHDVFDQVVAKSYFRNAAYNWRLALRFDEATRVENKIKKVGSNFDPDAFIASHGQPVPTPLPSPKKYLSTDPNAGEPNVFDQFDSSTAVPIPRARPVRSPSPR